MLEQISTQESIEDWYSLRRAHNGAYPWLNLQPSWDPCRGSLFLKDHNLQRTPLEHFVKDCCLWGEPTPRSREKCENDASKTKTMTDHRHHFLFPIKGQGVGWRRQRNRSRQTCLEMRVEGRCFSFVFVSHHPTLILTDNKLILPKLSVLSVSSERSSWVGGWELAKVKPPQPASEKAVGSKWPLGGLLV